MVQNITTMIDTTAGATSSTSASSNNFSQSSHTTSVIEEKKDFSYMAGLSEKDAMKIMETLSLDDKIAAMNAMFRNLNVKVCKKVI